MYPVHRGGQVHLVPLEQPVLRVLPDSPVHPELRDLAVHRVLQELPGQQDRVAAAELLDPQEQRDLSGPLEHRGPVEAVEQMEGTEQQELLVLRDLLDQLDLQVKVVRLDLLGLRDRKALLV